MSKSLISPRPSVSFETRHYAYLPWYWEDKYVFDYEYTNSVNSKMQAAVNSVCEKYGVTEDTELRCQWEGVQIYGEDLDMVQKAGKELASVLARFKHVVPID